MKALYTALMNAQKEFPIIPKNKTANVPTKSGGSYSYKYADLADIVKACMPILHKNGLVINDSGEIVEGKQCIVTKLFHIESGDELESFFLMPPTNDPQDDGASITYYRRYALCAILGIVTEEDTDRPKNQAVKDKQNTAQPSTNGPQTNNSDNRYEGVSGKESRLVTEPQLKRLFAIVKQSGLSDADVKEMVLSYGVDSSKKLNQKQYDELCKRIQPN